MTAKPTYLPRDDFGTPIQVLPCRAAGGWVVGIPASGLKLVGPFPATTRVVSIRAIGTAILFQPGTDNTVTVAVPGADIDGGGPHYLPAGERLDLALIAGEHEPEEVYLAVISAAATAGTLYISERG